MFLLLLGKEGVIRIRKSKKDGQAKKDKRTNNDLQNTPQTIQIEKHELHYKVVWIQVLRKDKQFLLH